MTTDPYRIGPGLTQWPIERNIYDVVMDARTYSDAYAAATALKNFVAPGNKRVKLIGLFDFGAPDFHNARFWQIPVGTMLKCDPGEATFQSNMSWQYAIPPDPGHGGASQFEFSDNIWLDGLIFNNTCPISEQCVTLGFGNYTVSGTAHLNNIVANGNTHTLYNWSLEACVIIATNSIFSGGRFVVGVGYSGWDGTGVRLDLDFCKIIADGNLSTYTGASDVGVRTLGIYQRGGHIRVRNSSVECRGTPRTAYPGPTTDLCGIWSATTTSGIPDVPEEGGNMNGRIEVYDTSVRVTPNGATGPINDLRMGSAQLVINGGSGSNSDGSYITQIYSPGAITINP